MTNKTYLEALIEEEKENGSIPVRESFKRGGELVDTTLGRLQDIYMDQLILNVAKKAFKGTMKKNEEDPDKLDFDFKLTFDNLTPQEQNLFLIAFNVEYINNKEENIKEPVNDCEQEDKDNG